MNATTPNGRPRRPRRPYPQTVPEEDFLPTVHEHASTSSLDNTLCVIIVPHKVSHIPRLQSNFYR
jgi:hypothetical protein